MSKRGVFGVLGKAILALGVFAIILAIFGPLLRDRANDAESFGDVKNWTDFQIYNRTPEWEDQLAIDSINALIKAINAEAEGKVIQGNKGFVDPAMLPFDRYEIIIAGKIELEEAWLNDYQYWATANSVRPSQFGREKISKLHDDWVFMDFKYGTCKESGGWHSCPTFSDSDRTCYCQDEDDPGDGWSQSDVKQTTFVHQAKRERIGAVAEINPFYNVELRTYDAEGNVLCRISTSDPGKKLTDWNQYGSRDMLVWGARSVETCNGKDVEDQGCDRDGDGIFGEYGEMYWGKEPPNAARIMENMPEVYQQLFPNGVVRHGGKGEGCMDAPVWLQCPGVRIYYCGKTGHKSNAETPKDEYFHMVDGQVHTRAGAKFQTFLDEQLTRTRASFKESGDSTYKIREETGGFVAWVSSAWDYALENDILVIGYVVDLVGGMFGHSARDYRDQKVSCYNGEAVGETKIPEVECDPTMQHCRVCNFNMPQEVAEEYEGWRQYVAGSGDPKYVIYYEAFPPGEEEPWQLDELSIGLETIVAMNIATAVIPATAKGAIKLLGKGMRAVAKKAGKIIFGEVAEEIAQRVAKEAAEKLGKELAEKGLREAGAQALSRTTRTAARDAAEQARKEALESISGRTAQKARDELLEAASGSAGREAVEKHVQEISERIAQQAGRKARNEMMERIGREFGVTAIEESSEQFAKEAADQVTRALIRDLPRRVSHEVAENALREGSQRAAQEAAEKLAAEIGEEVTKEFITETAQEIGERIYREGLERIGSGEIGRGALEEALKESTERAGREANEKVIQSWSRKQAQEAAADVAEEAAKDAARLSAQEAAGRAILGGNALGTGMKGLRYELGKLRLIRNTKAKIDDALSYLGRQGTKSVFGKKWLNRIWTKADDVFKYVDDEALAQIGRNSDEIAEHIIKQHDEVLRALSRDIMESGLLSQTDVFFKRLPKATVKAIKDRGSKYTAAYVIGTVMQQMTSMDIKYIPVGANNIGMARPFYGSIVSGEALDPVSEAVRKYNVMLIKDEFVGGALSSWQMGQNAQRFYLASPCENVNLWVKKTTRKCSMYDASLGGFIEEHVLSTGIFDPNKPIVEQPEPGSKAAEIYGNSPFVIESVDQAYARSDPKRYMDAIKLCIDEGHDLIKADDAVYGVETIIVDPVPLAGDRFGTFCYGGTDAYANMGRVGVFVGSIVMSVVADGLMTAITVGTAGAGYALGVAVKTGINILIDVGAAYLDVGIAKMQAWPNHSSIDQTEAS